MFGFFVFRTISLTFTASKIRTVVAKSFSRLHARKAASRIFGSGTRSYWNIIHAPVRRNMDNLRILFFTHLQAQEMYQTESICLRKTHIQYSEHIWVYSLYNLSPICKTELHALLTMFQTQNQNCLTSWEIDSSKLFPDKTQNTSCLPSVGKDIFFSTRKSYQQLFSTVFWKPISNVAVIFYSPKEQG